MDNKTGFPWVNEIDLTLVPESTNFSIYVTIYDFESKQKIYPDIKFIYENCKYG